MHILSLSSPLFLSTLIHAAVFKTYHSTSPTLVQKPSSVYDTQSNNLWSRNPSLRTRLDSKDQKQAQRALLSTTSQSQHRPLPQSVVKRSPTPANGLDTRPTPAPTGDPSPSTTVHITAEGDFALILPQNPGEAISDAESDGVSFCSRGASGDCQRMLPDGFILASAVTRSDDGSWIQITGCIDPSKFPMSSSDDGGQFDVRYPNGAQCTFGGYGASFIEQVEPSAMRFCMRCCSSANDQLNCNSHQDRAGCPVAIPGTYDFPEKGVSCS